MHRNRRKAVGGLGGLGVPRRDSDWNGFKTL